MKRNLENILLDSEENPIILPFFNLILDSKKNKDDVNQQKISDLTYITAFKFLIQSFNFSVDSETMEAILNFIENVTTQLNTSITIVFGFSILILSNFIPTIYFGLFTGLAMLLAMISVLTLLPSLILMIKPFGK